MSLAPLPPGLNEFSRLSGRAGAIASIRRQAAKALETPVRTPDNRTLQVSKYSQHTARTSTGAMAKVLEEAGVDLSTDITLSCKGGIAATVGYASLNDLAKAKLAVYDGSWAEYSKN